MSVSMFLCSIALGAALDLVLGDPPALPHPVVWFGRLIAFSERILRRVFPQTRAGERIGGAVLALFVPLTVFGGCTWLFMLLGRLCPLAAFLLHTFWCCQILAGRCLASETEKVRQAVAQQDLPLARQRLSFLVGRETHSLHGADCIRACVETIAENTTDGVTAPLFYLFLGGLPLAMAYKAVNTLDSMVGYRNQKYRYFGTASAKLDDLAGLIPARLTALCMIVCAGLCGGSIGGAWRIWRRDRRAHLSPNSAQTESAAAGAWGIQLGGAHIYHGEIVQKPYIGDSAGEPAPEHITKTNQLMLCTSALFFGVAMTLSVLAHLLF